MAPHNTNKGRSISTKGIPRPNSRKPRPHLWVTGPDPELRKRYYVYLQQRNQALWREEGWDIDFASWLRLWADHWHLRGRERGSYCMTRKDWSLPWTLDNVHVITRSEHAKAQGHAKASGWCSLARKRKKGQARRGTQQEMDLASSD